MDISQSFIKDFRKRECDHSLFLKYVEGKRESFDPENITSRDHGHLFEFFLLGAGTGDDDISERWPRLKNGNFNKKYYDIKSVASWANSLLKINGVDIDYKRVNQEIRFKDLRGRVDAFGSFKGREAILDVKYTDLAHDAKWSEYQWADKSRIDITQSVQYVTIVYLNTGKILPFVFLVFSDYGNRWANIIEVDVTVEMIQEHLSNIDKLKKEIPKGRIWNANPDVIRCGSCRVRDFCDRRLGVIPYFKISAK